MIHVSWLAVCLGYSRDIFNVGHAACQPKLYTTISYSVGHIIIIGLSSYDIADGVIFNYKKNTVKYMRGYIHAHRIQKKNKAQ